MKSDRNCMQLGCVHKCVVVTAVEQVNFHQINAVCRLLPTIGSLHGI